MSTFLILDDQATNRSILARLAGKIEEGGHVKAFAGPTDAFAWLDDDRVEPDLVITDFNMPDMNGADFIRRFRKTEAFADVPVIVVTAYEDRDLLYEALEAGATDFLLSPVDHREFATRARNLLNLRKQRNLRLAAERANAAKTEFLANMSHELRTPLNAIIGFAEMMQTETLGPIGTPRYLDYAHDIGNSASHLRNVIQDMLDVSRIEQGRMELSVAPVTLSDVLSLALRMVDAEAGKKSIGVDLTDKTGGARVRGDQAKLEQIFVNLMANAVKFTPDGGRISVEARIDADAAFVAVSDTGIGMSQEEIAVAVSRFGQVSGDPYSKRFQGLGLGLTLAVSLVELHGGRIEIDSRPGAGTRVDVTLPLDRGEVRRTA